MEYRARAFFNQRREYDDWKPGDVLAPSIVPAQTVEAEDSLWAAERLYDVLNAPERPNGPVECSLSHGDVVAVETDDGTVAYAVAAFGMQAIPLVLDIDEPWMEPGAHGPRNLSFAEAIRRYEERKQLLTSEVWRRSVGIES